MILQKIHFHTEHEILNPKEKAPQKKKNISNLEEVEGVESKVGIIGTDISIKELILSRPEVSFETPSPNCF